MRILYFHQHFGTPAGTGGTRSYEFAKMLVSRGHQVTVVCGQADRARTGNTAHRGGENRYSVEGIHIIELPLPYSNYDSIFTRSIIFLKYALKSMLLVCRESFDLLFATSTPLTAAIPGIFLKVFSNKTFVFEVRDLWPELPKAMGVVKNPLLLSTLGLLEYLAYLCADGCVGLSPGIVEGIRKRGSAELPIRFVPNGCDLDIFNPGNRMALDLPQIETRDLVAVFTGAHGLANGLDAVLDTASTLKKRSRNDIKLVFIGDGKLKPALRSRATEEGLDNCVFLDPMAKHLLAKVVANADVGLMILANVPAFYYGTSPNKFFDYLAAGLPVLINYPGWICELIEAHDCGRVVEPEDPELFADALEWFADHPQDRKSMGAKARLLGEQKFHRRQLAEDFCEFIESTEVNVTCSQKSKKLQ
ncbi:glycosyltransferase family 4 protein [Verrucomicrobia bacterium]|nr:glycosyltransferase family 4 protein [Verrucomicrobiota bacterium]